MKLAAVADIHCERGHRGLWAPLLEPVNRQADALLLAGDLTLTGDLGELAVLLEELKRVSVPIVAVLGNHDYDGGRARVFAERLRRAGIACLEGGATEIGDITVTGAMGVEGGFAPARRWSYAERQLMARLEHYLSAAATSRRVVLLHYAPILATLGDEPADLHELLGSSALEAAIDAAGADLILHGHAHGGAPEGRTRSGIPVYNVALPVLQRAGYTTPYRIIDI
jgi:Icc-related predicted phosphoesterase